MIQLIVAMTKSGLIGNNGELPWTNYEDLNHFKEITEHNTVVMGSRTFYSLKKPLVNRTVIVLSTKDLHSHRRDFEQRDLYFVKDMAGVFSVYSVFGSGGLFVA